MTQETLPRYMTKANHIIEILQAEPDQTWKKSQKDLSARVGLSQPELSSIVKLLLANRKVVKGDPIPGVRGKNNRLVLVDKAPFTEAVQRVVGAFKQDVDQENHERIREEQNARLREYREQLAEERAMRAQLAEERDELEAQLHEVRAQLNVALKRGSY